MDDIVALNTPFTSSASLVSGSFIAGKCVENTLLPAFDIDVYVLRASTAGREETDPIREFLESAERELREHLKLSAQQAMADQELPPTPASEERSLSIARKFLERIVTEPEVAITVFLDEGGATSVVIDAFEQRRRLMLNVSASGRTVEAHSIDERGTIEIAPFDETPTAIEGWIRWLTARI